MATAPDGNDGSPIRSPIQRFATGISPIIRHNLGQIRNNLNSIHRGLDRVLPGHPREANTAPEPSISALQLRTSEPPDPETGNVDVNDHQAITVVSPS